MPRVCLVGEGGVNVSIWSIHYSFIVRQELMFPFSSFPSPKMVSFYKEVGCVEAFCFQLIPNPQHCTHSPVHWHITVSVEWLINGPSNFYHITLSSFSLNLQNLIRECGGLSRLVALLTHPSKNINIKVAQVLSNLAMNERNQESLKVIEMWFIIILYFIFTTIIFKCV